MSNGPWTDEENDLIVADYFAMLADDISARRYSKAEHRRALLPLLNDRSEGSVEFKHQNISAVLKGLGWTVPCLVAEDGELIAGHGRVLAATQLGLTEAPVIVLGHLTEAQRRAYRIADNKLTELGTWDEALLSAELNDLLAEDFDLSLVGFSDGELDKLPSTWALPSFAKDDRPDHPTPKPLDAFGIPMRQHVARGGLCYEPFSGSGSQIMAGEANGRRVFAMEISPAYVDVAVERWQAETGRDGILDGDGRTFAEVRTERLGDDAGARADTPDPDAAPEPARKRKTAA